jgi:sialate O-acetylesterase
MGLIKKALLSFMLIIHFGALIYAQLSLPAIFGDHMVLQQKQSNPVWGWGQPGETVKVAIYGQSHMTTVDQEGYWKINLRPIPAGGPYRLEIEGEKSKFFFDDVLVGEVWICSGQSNMAWSVKNTNSAELDILTANYPDIRLISVPQRGMQEEQNDFDGEWTACSPESIKDFSAVGYFFGRRLHHALGVPIGLIDNAWGGSAAEAWIRRDVLEKDGRFDELMSWWADQERSYDYEATLEDWKQRLAEWEAMEESQREQGPPRRPNNIMTGNQRPANIFNGVLHPTIGYGIKGVIWYQGESNASRAYQYRDLFPLMIQHWRSEWEQGDFPFYYVQLADFRMESEDPGDSDWAELREAQTMTMDHLKNVGQAVIIDIGEGRDIHPRNKQMVANRLARWALAKDYGQAIQFRSPSYQSMKIDSNKITLTFDHVGQGLYAFDTQEPLGFTIAGEDQKFVTAKAKIVSSNQIEIWSEIIENPVAVRYAWADNPICNMYSRDGLPMTPFRTDDWPGVTYGKRRR